MGKENDEFIENIQIEGRQAILEAFAARRPVDRILFRDGKLSGNLHTIAEKAKEEGIVTQQVPNSRLDQISQTNNHQGVIALCPQKEYSTIYDMLELAKEREEDPFIIILDSIMDPHNLGAIIRSAECAGAHGVVIPERRAVGLTGVVARTSAGALEHMMVARVINLNNTIRDLKEEGLWMYCADMDGEDMYSTNMTGPIGLVIGGEGEGVSRMVRENSDHVVSIPVKGEINSLNASVAAGVVLYEVVRQRADG